MSIRSEYDRERDKLLKQREEGALTHSEYMRELHSVNRRERNEIRRLSALSRGHMGMIRWP